MRVGLLLIALTLAACSDDSLTRKYGLGRDAPPETMASTQMPLSMPPSLSMRPGRPGAPIPQADQRQADQSVGSTGQEALVQAAGPAAPADIRTLINEHSGMIYPSPAFTEALMNWSPPPGYTPLTAPARKGWLSRLF
jgi:hypothetical protein